MTQHTCLFLREITSIQELLPFLKLRYNLFREVPELHAFCPENTEGLDLDFFDLRSRHLGLYAGSQPVGYTRMITAHPAALAGGLSLMTGGIALRIWAIRVLGRFFTSTVRVQEGQRVIAHGPFRHPSYLGVYLAFAGSAVFLQAWAGLIIALLAMGLAYRIRIGVEERELLRVFGAEYATYRQRSWRMAPGLW